MSKNESSLLQEEYIQKSRLFLLPLTGLKINNYFKATNTYIASPDLISDEYPEGISFADEILILAYSKEYKIKQDNIYNQVQANFKNISLEETGWDKYENILIANKRFMSFHESPEEYLYTFNMHHFANDWSYFLKGRYSKMSDKAKNIVKDYRWSSLKPIEQRKLYCYLWPNETPPDEKKGCFEFFAEELGIPVEDLEQVKELCSKPNFKLETYTYSEKKQFNEIKS